MRLLWSAACFFCDLTQEAKDERGRNHLPCGALMALLG